MTRNFRIALVLYSHPWVVQLLGSEGVVDIHAESVMIEVSETSHLSMICPDRKEASLGPLPLLRRPRKVDLAKMARSYPMIPAPLILAPNPATTASLLMDALLILESTPQDLENVYLLCHVAHAEQFMRMFPICDSIQIVWDLADYPSPALEQCVDALQASGSLEPGRWGGFTVCEHWLRKTQGHAERRAFLEALIDQKAA